MSKPITLITLEGIDFAQKDVIVVHHHSMITHVNMVYSAPVLDTPSSLFSAQY